MNAKQNRVPAIFNEWARRYAAAPQEFGAIVDAEGKAVEDYGARCAVYFDQIGAELDAAGASPEASAA